MKDKQCQVCHHVKPLGEFRRSRNCADGYNDMCEICAAARRTKTKRLRQALGLVDQQYSREAWLKNKYGIDQETYDQLCEKQGNRCAICKCREPLFVDHDHLLANDRAQAIRGLLCNKCNTGLGMFRDSPRLLRLAIKYLEDFDTKRANSG